MTASEQDPMAEAYHVLGQIKDGQGQIDTELKQLRDQANQEHADLIRQLQEAEEMGDEASAERIRPLLDQAQQAWIVANEALGDEPEPDEPETERPAGDEQPAPEN